MNDIESVHRHTSEISCHGDKILVGVLIAIYSTCQLLQLMGCIFSSCERWDVCAQHVCTSRAMAVYIKHVCASGSVFYAQAVHVKLCLT